MNLTGHGRPCRAALLALACTAGAALALPTPPASAANVAAFTTKAPPENRVKVMFAYADLKPRRGALPSRVPVRVVGRSLPSGVTAAAVAEPVRSGRAVVRFVIANKGSSGRELRLRVAFGTARRVSIGLRGQFNAVVKPNGTPLRARECRQARARAGSSRAVPGMRRIAVGAERFAAADALGGAVQLLCGRIIPSVDQEVAGAFLDAVNPAYTYRAGGTLEGYATTWSFDEEGNAKVCVYVRGARGGRGDVTIAGRTRAFRLDSDGLSRIEAPVAGPGTYRYRVRFSRGGGRSKSLNASVTLPESRQSGDPVVDPYRQAGRCA